MRVYATAWLLALAPAPAAGQNLPPVAYIDVSVAEPTVGSAVELSGERSFDPDDGPAPLTYRWTFGDGVSASGARVTHVFDSPGAHTVLLRVDDSEASTETAATVYVLAPIREPRARASSAIVLADGELWLADRVRGRVLVLDTSRREWIAAIDLGSAPIGVALSAQVAFVVTVNEIVLVDRTTRTVRGRRALDAEPSAVVSLAGGALITCRARGLLVRVDANGDERARIEVGEDAGAIAVRSDGSEAFIAHFLTRAPRTAAGVSVVDLVDDRIVDRIELAEDPGPDTPSSGRGVLNVLGAIGIEPSGERLWVGGLKSNTSRGRFVSGRDLTPDNRTRGVLAPVSLRDHADAIEQRIDTNDADRVAAIAFSPSGRYAYLAQPGIGALTIYDLARARLFVPDGRGSTVPFTSRLAVADALEALAIDGARLYALSTLAAELVEIDVTDPAAPRVASRLSLGDDPRAAEIALGARLFQRSTAPVHSESGYVACASCHPDGGFDGRTWDFTQAGEGLRNTIDLRGRGGLAHGPLHWSANFDEVQDFENDIVHGFGGTGLAMDGAPPNPPLGAPNAGRSEVLDALAAYVTSLDRPRPSPFARDERSERGRALFFDARVGCATCHSPPRFTDSDLDTRVVHDVGTMRPSSGGRLGGALRGIDTPSLLGGWATAPYLHDGRAASLRDVLTIENAGDRHGATSHLSAAEIDDLVSYLRTIDGAEAERTPPPRGCGVAAPGTTRSSLLLALCAAAVCRRARRRHQLEPWRTT